MKTKIIVLLLVSFTMSTAIAQELNGIATYKRDQNFDIPKSEGMDDAMLKQINAQMKRQFQKEFTLSFNKDQSMYEQIETLAPPVANSTGIQIEFSDSSDLVYRNTKEKTYLHATEIMGKEFLIEDVSSDQEWKLEKETKNIGQYLCFKASRTRTEKHRRFNEETQEFEASEKEVAITVWYTPSIPVKHGPDDYYGLPGLVLEVHDGDLSILCSKIVLNPKDGLQIEKPTKGKKVDQKTFDDIQDKKMKEMQEQSQRRKNKKGSKATHIEIRG